MPTRAEMVKATTGDQRVTIVFMPASGSAVGNRDAEENAKQSAGGGEHHGFDNELLDDVAALCAKGAANADLRVRSVTLASMMFMMPMPPTNSEMAAMEPRTMLKICLVRSARLRSSRGTTIS